MNALSQQKTLVLYDYRPLRTAIYDGDLLTADMPTAAQIWWAKRYCRVTCGLLKAQLPTWITRDEMREDCTCYHF